MPLDDRTGEAALAAAVDAAHRASDYLRAALGRAHSVRHKGGNVADLVTEADLASEDLIRRRLRAACPSWGFLCEEGGAEGPSDTRWIVDPLDGTTNFAHGLPIFAIAIALEHEGAIEVAAVDAPMFGMVWTARTGRGACRNGHPIRVSVTPRLDQSLLATGFPYDLKVSPDNNFEEFARLQLRAQAVRRCGSAVLDLAWLAEGTFDGYWEKKLKPWDWATGALLVSEADGHLSDARGGPFSVLGDTLVASNGLIHAELLSALEARGS